MQPFFVNLLQILPRLGLAGLGVIVAVRGLHHVEIARICLRDIGEGLEALVALREICAVRAAGEHAVDDADDLGTGDRAVRLIRTLDIVQIASGDDGGDVLIAPERGRDIGELHAALFQGEEAGGHRAEFCAGDGLGRLERAVGVAGDDALGRQRLDRSLIPLARRDVGELDVLRHRLIEEETIEDRRGLGAGEVAVRLERAVGIARDVREVVGVVEPQILDRAADIDVTRGHDERVGVVVDLLDLDQLAVFVHDLDVVRGDAVRDLDGHSRTGGGGGAVGLKLILLPLFHNDAIDRLGITAATVQREFGIILRTAAVPGIDGANCAADAREQANDKDQSQECSKMMFHTVFSFRREAISCFRSSAQRRIRTSG